MHLVSGYMIVLNEAPFVHHAVASIVDKVDELLVMDCGSTDETMSLLTELRLLHPKLTVIRQAQEGSRYSDEWREPARRNLCLSLLRHDWFLTIDGDEYLEADNDLFRRLNAPARLNVVNIVPGGSFLVSHQRPDYYRRYSPDPHIRFAQRRGCRYTETPLHCFPVGFDESQIVCPDWTLIWHYNAAYKQLGLLYQHNPEEFTTEEYRAVAPIPLDYGISRNDPV